MVIIGGIAYEPCLQSTLYHDDYVQALLKRSGMDDLQMRPNETAAQIAQRLLNTLSANIDVFELLGCMLIPAGTDPLTWTPALARQTGEHLGGVHLPADKALIRREIATLIQGFWTAKLVSAWHIPKYGDSQGQPIKFVSPTSGASPSERGRSWSESLPITTSTVAGTSTTRGR